MMSISRKPFLIILIGISFIFLFVFLGIYLFRVDTAETAARNAGKEEKFVEQADLLQKLYKLQPYNKELPIQVAEAYFLADDLDNASVWFAKAGGISTLNFEQNLRYGQALIKADNVDEAREVFTFMENRPNLSAEEIIALSDEWRKLGDLEESYSTLTSWGTTGNELNEKIAWRIATLGAVLHIDSALQAILEITAKNPPLREILSPLIGVLDTPTMPEAEQWAEVGRFLFENQEWDLAENAFLNSTGLRPTDSEAWAMLGESRLMQGKNGYPDLVKAMRVNDRSQLGRYFLAIYWRDRGQADVAKKYLETLSAEEPREPLWLVELAKTAQVAGDTSQALAYYQSATEIYPENVEIWQALGEFCLVTGIDLKGFCEEAVQQAILLAPEDPVSNDLMGWLMLTGGDPDNALKFLRRSVASDSTYARSHLHLAQAMWGVGETDSALIEFRQALALDPDGPVGLTAARLLGRYFPGE